MGIRNIYKDGMPVEKAIVLNNNVLLKPILLSDFFGKGGNGLHYANVDEKKAARAALAFRIIGVGPKVENPEIQAGRIAVVSEASLDFADPNGTHLVCEESDLKLIWTEKDLEESQLVAVENKLVL